jgi:hypothetical protein
MTNFISYSLVEAAGLKVKTFDQIPCPGEKLRMMWIGAYGCFRPEEPNAVYVNNKCPRDEVDYVLLHEAGHATSISGAKREWFIAARAEAHTIQGNDHPLHHIVMKWILTEELIADRFAYRMMQVLKLPMPEHLTSRLSCIAYARLYNEAEHDYNAIMFDMAKEFIKKAGIDVKAA